MKLYCRPLKKLFHNQMCKGKLPASYLSDVSFLGAEGSELVKTFCLANNLMSGAIIKIIYRGLCSYRKNSQLHHIIFIGAFI